MHQFWALLYKGLQLRKRHYILTILEIVIPTLIIIIPAIVKFAQISEQCTLPFYGKVGRSTSGTWKFWQWVDKRTYPSFKPFDYLSDHAVGDLLFAYTPPNNVTKNLVMDSIALWKNNVKVSYSNATVRKFASEEEMEKFCLRMRRSVDSKTVIGTVFNNFDSITELPSSLDYKIRYAHDAIWYNYQVDAKYRDGKHVEENAEGF
ncbi:uncharacterized protein LOC118195199 [Stegodyphus dumicola]|uniref:uncharacterized protein LOC118195199 n=1 Tax=Stegodyphus dumicola TaxID=202533 RepID=UPI0015B02072|nr:uncharacterized protein LOC118195199 [Stegodyphus dumicola]